MTISLELSLDWGPRGWSVIIYSTRRGRSIKKWSLPSLRRWYRDSRVLRHNSQCVRVHLLLGARISPGDLPHHISFHRVRYSFYDMGHHIHTIPTISHEDTMYHLFHMWDWSVLGSNRARDWVQDNKCGQRIYISARGPTWFSPVHPLWEFSMAHPQWEVSSEYLSLSLSLASCQSDIRYRT